MLDKGIADAGARSHENPIAAVQAVLRTLDGGRGIARREGCRMATTHFSRGWTYLEVLYRRRRIVDFEALAFALGSEGEGRGIRRRVGGGDFQVVGAVRKRGGVPRIEFLLEVVLQ